MRLFLAVAPQGQFTAELATRLDAARAAVPLRWTRPDSWHLTLQFLGEWPDERVNALLPRLDAVDPGDAFVLRPGGLGAFPDLARPRVLFLHLGDDGQSAALAGRLRDAVAAAWPDGPQDVRPLRPHLTLARVGAPLEREQLKILQDMELSGLPDIPVEGFALVCSALGPGGSRYSDVAFWRMRKKGE
ncbi:MAG TPA: RNA 2',3'-cyclic phosphodiesterase [Candidatus Krumholzibacteria bacterium]|nr:RNA 2',3'-cyclic phosphodiesterase [Candidatus Krumholzibacteria bacterium]